ncbi:Serine/threonine-protein phosphatase 4 regulatory subunit 3B [Metarhizium brunneum]|uniref:Serine/threonine-protein phosphatase 4 regulatory subunit 3B n=1 Tax=Metarhizium brunneum TaxID=500148 RepID=A0A7D5UPJ5_9HYPO
MDDNDKSPRDGTEDKHRGQVLPRYTADKSTHNFQLPKPVVAVRSRALPTWTSNPSALSFVSVPVLAPNPHLIVISSELSLSAALLSHAAHLAVISCPALRSRSLLLLSTAQPDPSPDRWSPAAAFAWRKQASQPNARWRLTRQPIRHSQPRGLAFIKPLPTRPPENIGHLSSPFSTRRPSDPADRTLPQQPAPPPVAVVACASCSPGAQQNRTVAALTILSHETPLPELSLQQHLDIAPDLAATYRPLATEADSEPVMMAQQVPHQATDKKRVKVYELRDNDWFDRGTGFCTAAFATTEDGQKDPRVIVESEDQPNRLLLETKIQKEDGFQKQQETLIVWQEPGSGVDMALSFQEAEGCALIWRFVSNVQQTFQNTIAGDDGLSDDLAIEVPATISLPAAELGNLPEIESGMRFMSSSANGRDALAKFIMADDYIGKLIPLVEMAEDLESLPDLHRLCNIMKTIILLNDTTIIEHAVSDECVLGVVGALEYDPDFPSHKANHRHWLDNQGRYKEVVRIEDEQTRQKIHQTYRLQYLKDVVLARILDDPTFSVLNSLIFFNQVDILQHLQSNSEFLNELFGIFNIRRPDQKKRKDAVLFIQQCCAIAKNIQPPARQSLYNNFIAHGLLQVIHFGLKHGDVAVRVGATDILVSIIDHDPQMIRQTIYRQMHENTPSLVDSLIELLLVEVDLGVKSQISEALKVLLDQGIPPPGPEFARMNGEFPGRPRPQPAADPQQELFLTRFYERSVLKLFKPLLELDNKTGLEFSVQQASMFTYLVEISCFFIRQHHRFSRYFVMNHNIIQRVSRLLKNPEKYLRLVAIRFFRNIIGMQEEFYIKQVVEKQALGPALEVLAETLPRDNLLSSACLELFEFIKKENLRDLVKYLVANHRDLMTSLSYLTTFKDMIQRYDQTQGYTANMDYFLEENDEMARKPPPHTRLMEHITVDPSEEEYWNTSDPEDDDEEHRPDVRDKILPSNGPLTPSKPLVDYPSDEESDENSNTEGDTATKANNGPEESAATRRPSLPSVASPPERLSEKRRREEDEEDEIGKLMHNKRRNSSSSESNFATGSRMTPKRKPFGGGSGNGKIAISLSTAVRTGGGSRPDEES